MDNLNHILVVDDDDRIRNLLKEYLNDKRFVVSTAQNSKEAKVFGIYDPADNDFDLNMWSSTKAEDIKSSLKRLEKIKLSKTADEILERILMSSKSIFLGDFL